MSDCQPLRYRRELGKRLSTLIEERLERNRRRPSTQEADDKGNEMIIVRVNSTQRHPVVRPATKPT